MSIVRRICINTTYDFYETLKSMKKKLGYEGVSMSSFVRQMCLNGIKAELAAKGDGIA